MSMLYRFAAFAAAGVLLPSLVFAQTTPLETTTSLTAVGSQSGPQGTVFALHAAVTDANGPVPYGAVTFYNGDPTAPTASLGTVVINKATGIATFKTGSFTVGPHSITAKFTGTNKDAVSASSNVDLTVTVTKKFASSVTLHALAVGAHNELSAWVTGSAPLTLDGTVTFTDTTTHTVLGTASLNLPLLRTGFAPPIYDFNEYGYGAGTFLVDFNGDGNLDQITVQGSPSQGMFSAGHGDGTFAMPVKMNSTIFKPTLMAVGDLNNDGKLDIVSPCRTGVSGPLSICVFFGNGDGTLDSPQIYPANQTTQSIAIADLNGDGRQDFVVGWQGTDGFYGGVTLFTNYGDSFGSQEIYNQSTTQVAIADFNGDNKPDLLVGTGRTPPQVLFGHGNGTFTLAAADSNLAPNTPFVVGDFNGDGKPDVASSITTTVFMGLLKSG
jgi:Bacterial Ig-like domain (group 3)/FG-GAP-like repeat